MPLKIGVLEETAPNEARVALTPEVAGQFAALGASIHIQRGAGRRSHFPDDAYASATFHTSADEVLEQADLLGGGRLRPEAVAVALMQAHSRLDVVRALLERRVTGFAMELIPRISRAQSMDALSSQGAVAGYKATVLAADTLDKFFPMLTTAAGTIRPATVLVIGTGVAGLQAIATARRLGAVVEAYDVRAATKEQAESLGARFIDTGISAEGEGGYARELSDEEKQAQQAVLDEHIARADVVITTAAIPGRPAPRIISAATVAAMAAGSVIVDIAAETGGNCELTRAGETVITDNGIKIVGPQNLPSQLARHASQMYARNLLNFLKPAIEDGELRIDWEDEVFAEALLTRDGELRHAGTAALLENQR